MKAVIIKMVISGEYAERISALDEEERELIEHEIRYRVRASFIYPKDWTGDCECEFLYPKDFFYSGNSYYTYFIMKNPGLALDTIMNFMLLCWPGYYEEDSHDVQFPDCRIFLSWADISVFMSVSKLEYVSSAFEDFLMFEKIARDGDIIICDSMLEALEGCGEYEILKSEQITTGDRIINAHKMKYMNPRTDNIPYVTDLVHFLRWDDDRLAELLGMFEADTIRYAIRVSDSSIIEKFRKVTDKDKWDRIAGNSEPVRLSDVDSESNRIMMAANMLLSGKKYVRPSICSTQEHTELYKRLRNNFLLSKNGVLFV